MTTDSGASLLPVSSLYTPGQDRARPYMLELVITFVSPAAASVLIDQFT